MWKLLQTLPPFYINVTQEVNYDILVTNYVKIWCAIYSENCLIESLKESNFGLEIERAELLNNVEEMFNRPHNLKTVNIIENESFLTVTINRAFVYPFNCKLKLKEGPPELFFQKITQPLLKTITDLKNSENQLCSILTAKEEEIQEYKLLGGKIKYGTTPKFSEDEHKTKHSTYKQYFGASNVSNILLEKTVNIPDQIFKVKQESVTIKVEPLSQQDNQNGIPDCKNIKLENTNTEIAASEASIPRKKKKLKLTF